MNSSDYRFCKFDNFIKAVDLKKYRQKYSRIKTVELDLPKNIQALNNIYQLYWEKINLEKIPQYEEFYQFYLETNKNVIEDFRKKIGMCENCFYTGLEARIYRTWASIITQIHAGYVAEKVFGIGNVKQKTELDHKGVDIQVIYNKKEINIQVKKESKRPEARISRKSDDNLITIKYVVPIEKDIQKPYYSIGKKAGQLKPQVMDLVQFNPQQGFLERYQNGFIVFTEAIFNQIKEDFK